MLLITTIMNGSQYNIRSLLQIHIVTVQHYYSPLRLSGIGEYRNRSSLSVCMFLLAHSSMMAEYIFFTLGTMIRYHGPLMHVKPGLG